MTILKETRQQPKTTVWLKPGSIAGSTDVASLVTVNGIASRVVLDPKNGTATKSTGSTSWLAFSTGSRSNRRSRTYATGRRSKLPNTGVALPASSRSFSWAGTWSHPCLRCAKAAMVSRS